MTTSKGIRQQRSWGEQIAEWAGRKAAEAKHRKDVMACRVMGHELPGREQRDYQVNGNPYSIWICGRCDQDVRT